MTFLWLFVWLVKGTPAVHFTGDNNWAVALVVCAVLDLFVWVKA